MIGWTDTPRRIQSRSRIVLGRVPFKCLPFSFRGRTECVMRRAIGVVQPVIRRVRFLEITTTVAKKLRKSRISRCCPMILDIRNRRKNKTYRAYSRMLPELAFISVTLENIRAHTNRGYGPSWRNVFVTLKSQFYHGKIVIPPVLNTYT